MRQQGSGIVVNIGSIGGVIGLPFQAIYSATKFALEGLTEGLRQEVAQWGIRVVLVEPGDVRTRITENRIRATASNGSSAYQAAFRSALQVIESEERAGIDPSEVARVVVRIVRQAHPPVCVRVGKLGQRAAVVAKRTLDSRLFERILMKHYGVG